MVITINGIIGKDVKRKWREKKLCLHIEKNVHQADNMGNPEISEKS